MRPRGVDKEGILEALEAIGGATKENIRTLSRQTGVPESEIYGVASFYHLIEHVDRRVCTSEGGRASVNTACVSWSSSVTVLSVPSSLRCGLTFQFGPLSHRGGIAWRRRWTAGSSRRGRPRHA